MASPLNKPAPHESGVLHVTGEATYVDDLAPPYGMLVGWAVCSPFARAKILSIDTSEAAKVEGVHAVLTHKDIPGVNDISPFSHDEPLLAVDEVFCVGQAIAVVFAEDLDACRAAAKLVHIEFEELPAVLTIQAAIEAGEFQLTPHRMQRGDVDAALASAPVRIQGSVETGGQDHFYLESHCAMAEPDENDTWLVHSSTQHPSEVQAKVAEVLGIRSNQVVVETRRMGGGFGGKETQGAYFAAYAALGALATGRPCKVWLNRDQDMSQTGKRHPFESRYDAGFDNEGRIVALKVHTYADGGWSADLSGPILDRCLFHLDNSYYIPNLRFEGRVCRTNLVSNTAFRGFGGPQGMAVVEHCIDRCAERLGLDPAVVRVRNFYGEAPRNKTPYDQEVVFEDNRLARIADELLSQSEYTSRREQIEKQNAGSAWVKRGIGFQPVKFGISFTNSMLNQAGALVHIYADGTVQLNHGGTEMGQGLHTKMLALAAHELGVPLDSIRIMTTSTEKVPNTSATAASSGSDLNGMAVQQACRTLVERLRPVAADLLGLSNGGAQSLRFREGRVYDGDKSVGFAEVTMAAYARQISMSATGFYRTPDIGYDHATGKGKPFHYYAYGGAVVEMEVNGLTGEHRIVRVDILHDVGSSLVPTIDIGQVEGGFIQGFGWLTCEELVWSDKGVLRTHSPDTYKIPAFGEAPLDFRVALLERAPQHNVVHGSKAVGEPPFMLALGAVTALRMAVRAFANVPQYEAELRIPCTPEAVLYAVEHALQSQKSSSKVAPSTTEATT